LKFTVKGKAGGGDTNMSPIGPYDRALDEDPTEPLAFEEQFILRVPRGVAEGPNGLKEILKGKGKGLESVEFKFLGAL
jgi:transcription initiation factor TFIID subunit 7